MFQICSINSILTSIKNLMYFISKEIKLKTHIICRFEHILNLTPVKTASKQECNKWWHYIKQLFEHISGLQ